MLGFPTQKILIGREVIADLVHGNVGMLLQHGQKATEMVVVKVGQKPSLDVSAQAFEIFVKIRLLAFKASVKDKQRAV